MPTVIGRRLLHVEPHYTILITITEKSHIIKKIDDELMDIINDNNE